MNFCKSCCCCTQKDTNNKSEQIDENKLKNKVEPVYVIDTGTRTGQQPIINQPKSNNAYQEPVNSVIPISSKKIVFLGTTKYFKELDRDSITYNSDIIPSSSYIKTNSKNEKFPEETNGKIELNLTNPDKIPHQTYKEFRLNCLEIHNALRVQHGCPYLKENEDLNKFAQIRATKIFQNNFEYFEDDEKLYGENHFWTDEPNTPIDSVVQAWYDNIKFYNFKKHQGLGNFNHFTQIIWKGTLELGTAIIKKDDNMFVLCVYNPSGKLKEEINEFITPETGSIFRVSNEHTTKSFKNNEDGNELVIRYDKPVSKDELNEYMLPQPVSDFRVTNEYIQKYMKCIRQSSLDFHNHLRSLHGCQELLQNDKLDKLAKEILDFYEVGGNINSLPLEKKRFVGHNSSRTRDYDLMTVTIAIQNWYDDGKTYDYENLSQDNDELNDERCFMQIINRDTIAMGTDMRKINDEIWIYCVYYPPRSLDKLYKHYLIPRPLCQKLYKPLEMYPEEMRWSCLETHNRLRDLHGCPPLTSNPILDKCAEEWAKHLAETNKLYYRINIEYGESLFWSSDQYTSVVTAVEEWYDEIKLYNYNKPELSAENGHFTQLIWNDTMELGTGIARNEKGVYVVCIYDPPGNILNRINDTYIPEQVFERQI